VRDDFLKSCGGLLPHYDVVLLDTGAGISDVVLFAVSLASEVLVVATPEPTSLTDAYATIKVLVGTTGTPRDPHGRQSDCAHGRRPCHHGTAAAGAGPFCGPEPGTKCVKLVHMGDIPADPVGAPGRDAPPVADAGHAGLSGALAISQLAGKLEETDHFKPQVVATMQRAVVSSGGDDPAFQAGPCLAGNPYQAGHPRSNRFGPCRLQQAQHGVQNGHHWHHPPTRSRWAC
jgi:hypothetical protein